MVTLNWASVVAFIAIIGGINGGFVLWKNIKEKRANSPLAVRVAKLEEDYTPDNTKLWEDLHEWQKTIEEETVNRKDILMALAQDRIMQAYRYYKDQEVPIAELQPLQHLYDAYKTAGGNGIAKKAFEEILSRAIH